MRLRWPYGIAFLLTALTSAWALQQPGTDNNVVAAAVTHPARPPQVESKLPESKGPAQPAIQAQNHPANGEPKPLKLGVPSMANAETALFSRHDWAPPPPPPPKPAPPPKPTAPELPYRFMGRLLQDGKAPQVYLTNGNRAVVAQAGSVVDDVYRVESISDELLTLTYLPLNQQQTLALGR